MSEINVYVGAQIRKYRKACKLTIQELADDGFKAVCIIDP